MERGWKRHHGVISFPSFVKLLLPAPPFLSLTPALWRRVAPRRDVKADGGGGPLRRARRALAARATREARFSGAAATPAVGLRGGKSVRHAVECR
jgi:hypothetical protein